jgi:hypothetical protein
MRVHLIAVGSVASYIKGTERGIRRLLPASNRTASLHIAIDQV